MIDMEPTHPILQDLSEADRLQLLQTLLNDLHARGMLRSETLLQIATDVMQLAYHEDDDLLCYDHGDHEIEEE